MALNFPLDFLFNIIKPLFNLVKGR